MSVPSEILMNLLSSGVRAISGATPAGAPVASESGFASLLDRARAGEVSTGLPVSVARGSGIDLSDDQLARLAGAADRAESAGVTRALALIDGRAVEIDIPTRQVVREHSLAPTRVVAGINGVIDLGGHPGTQGADEADAGLAASVAAARIDGPSSNRSLLEALASRAR